MNVNAKEIGTIAHPNGLYVCSIVASDVACYAYVLKESEIVGWVWIFNTAHSPLDLESQKGTDGPANAAEYSIDANLPKPLNKLDIGGKWLFRDDEWQCGIYIEGKLSAIVTESNSPGWSKYAKKDGPLAFTF